MARHFVERPRREARRRPLARVSTASRRGLRSEHESDDTRQGEWRSNGRAAAARGLLCILSNSRRAPRRTARKGACCWNFWASMGAGRPWKSNRELHGWEKQRRQGDLAQRPLQGVELAPMGGKMAGRALENREGRHGYWGRLLQGSGSRPWLLVAERAERGGKKGAAASCHGRELLLAMLQGHRVREAERRETREEGAIAGSLAARASPVPWIQGDLICPARSGAGRGSRLKQGQRWGGKGGRHWRSSASWAPWKECRGAAR